MNNFNIPPEFEATRSIPFSIGSFFMFPKRFLRMNNDFGILEIHSEFFYGRTGLVQSRYLHLNFTLEDCDEIISLQFFNSGNGQILNAQNPGRTVLLKIPLHLDFMRYPNGDLRFNAAEYIYIDRNGNDVSRVIPRSFIDDEYLYININRTGRLRLTRTPHGNTNNIVNFLGDRNISVEGYGEQRIVSRGEFYYALMGIHWAEQLEFDMQGVGSFPDPPRGGNLERKLNIGQSLGVLVGFPDGDFKHDYPLMRNHMFIMLAGNIRAFGFEINDLMPADPNAIGMPQYEPYWYDAMQYLKYRGFFPYRRIGDRAYIAAYESVTVEEAKEIIYRLIIADRFAVLLDDNY